MRILQAVESPLGPTLAVLRGGFGRFRATDPPATLLHVPFRFASGGVNQTERIEMISKLKTTYVWVLSPDGRKDLGALVAVVTAIYTALHRAGV